MYKSRVETFNQVRYFNRLIFVVYITRWWVKNKLQYSVWMPEQKYTSGRGRQNIILGMWRWLLHRWQVRWVHVPLEMGCLMMCISKLPFVLIFQLADHRDGGGGRKPCYRIIQRQREQTHCHCVIGMVKQLFDLHHGLNVWQKRCFALEWSRLNGALKAWFATKGFASIARQRLSIERSFQCFELKSG